MNTKEKVDELKGIIEAGELKGVEDATEIASLERMQYSLADAIREGALVSKQATGDWGEGDTMCAMHAAVTAAAARGYMKVD